jgi:hypothetical protein
LSADLLPDAAEDSPCFAHNALQFGVGRVAKITIL